MGFCYYLKGMLWSNQYHHKTLNSKVMFCYSVRTSLPVSRVDLQRNLAWPVWRATEAWLLQTWNEDLPLLSLPWSPWRFGCLGGQSHPVTSCRAAERMTWWKLAAGSRTGHRAGAFSSRSEHVHHVAPRGTHFADMFHQQNSRTAEQPPHLHVAPVLGRPSCGLLPHGRLPRHSSAAAGSLPGRSGFLLCPTDQGGPE